MSAPKTITLKVLTNVSTWENHRDLDTGKLVRIEAIHLNAGELLVVPLSEYVNESPRMLVPNRHSIPVYILKSNTIVIK